MSSKDGLNIEGLDQWLNWLKKLEASDVDRMKDRMLRSIGMQGIANTQRHTDRRTGRLIGSLSIGVKDNIFEIQVGHISHVFYGTAVSYASAVEFGHTQEKGRFVPGFWKNGTFHYQPGYETGMVLTGKIIEGKHMFQRGIDDLANGQIDRIAEFEFRRIYDELFRG